MSFEIYHPMIVHFPIALFLSALFMEILSFIRKSEAFHRTAFHIYLLAATAAPFAVITGLKEAEELQIKHPVLDLHRNFGLLTMWFAIASVCLLLYLRRKNPKMFRKTFIVVLICCGFFVSGAGYNGGRLVYEYGVGIDKE